MSLLYENFHLLHDIGVLFRHIAIFMNIVFKIEKLHRSLGILTKIQFNSFPISHSYSNASASFMKFPIQIFMLFLACPAK